MTENNIRLAVHVHPSASKNEIVGFTDDVLHVKVAAPPVKGKANKELVSFLSKRLGLSKSSIAVIKGQSSHHKIISIDGVDQADFIHRLSS